MTVWSTPADIEAKVRRRWAGLLTGHAQGLSFEPIEVPLRGPSAREIAEDLTTARAWVDELTRHDARCYTLVHKQVGGRGVGRNSVPARAVVSSYEQAWALLRVRREVDAFDRIMATVAGHPVALDWVVAHPTRALALADEWPRLLAAVDWLTAHRGSGRYLREVSAPGVDTKFIESHRGVLAELVGGDGRADAFARSLGLLSKPATVRLRFDREFVGLPWQLSEATFRVDELVRVQVAVQSAVIVENEITYLSVPVPHEGVVIFGEGFRVSRAGSLPWLRDVPVRYWGDLDTHGFAILHQLRAWLPQTESLLMDTETLLAHRERWGAEPSPTTAVLDRLTADEQSVYADLVTDRHAPRLRLEQERIDWEWALHRLPD